MPSVLRAGAVGLLASATLALELGTSTDVRPQRPAALTRRTALFVLPALAVQPQPAWAGQVGGAGTGGLAGGTATQGGGPPKLKSIPPLTKGEPGPEEIRRLALGYQRLKYLLENWEKETTVCIKGCKGKYEACGCTRDPVIVQAYMGYKSMEDPLFKAGDLMLRASSLVRTDSDFEKYTIAMEKWNNQADDGNIMAYVSSWGEANPGGGQDEIARYLEKSRKTVLIAASLLKEICGYLDLSVDA